MLYDTDLKSNAETNKELTFMVRDRNITVAPSVSVPRKYCSCAQCPLTKVTLSISPSFVGLVVILQRT